MSDWHWQLKLKNHFPVKKLSQMVTKMEEIGLLLGWRQISTNVYDFEFLMIEFLILNPPFIEIEVITRGKHVIIAALQTQNCKRYYCSAKTNRFGQG